jgi:hypothetical protein
MSTRLKWLVGALSAWTVFLWGNRISNAWLSTAESSTNESMAAKVTSTVLAASFLALALGAVVVLVRHWHRPLGEAGRRFLTVFAGWTVLVWGVRILGIVLADHSVAFKVVHAVLGLVSIGLAVALVRALRSLDPATSPTSPLGSSHRVSSAT